MLEHPLAEERPHLVQEDHVDAPAGGEVGQTGGEARLEAPPVDLGAFADEDRQVEIAVGPRRPAGLGAEDRSRGNRALPGDERSHRLRDGRTVSGDHATNLMPPGG